MWSQRRVHVTGTFGPGVTPYSRSDTCVDVTCAEYTKRPPVHRHNPAGHFSFLVSFEPHSLYCVDSGRQPELTPSEARSVSGGRGVDTLVSSFLDTTGVGRGLPGGFGLPGSKPNPRSPESDKDTTGRPDTYVTRRRLLFSALRHTARVLKSV